LYPALYEPALSNQPWGVVEEGLVLCTIPYANLIFSPIADHVSFSGAISENSIHLVSVAGPWHEDWCVITIVCVVASNVEVG